MCPTPERSSTFNRMRFARRFLVLQVSCVLAGVLLVGCNTETGPDPRVPPAVGTPWSLSLEPCEYAVRSARCRVIARWGDLYSSTKDVTATARWTSDAPQIVSVAAGVLQAMSPGTANITIEYNGRSRTDIFRVLDEGPPWYSMVGPSIEFQFKVSNPAGAPLEGVLVEVTAGALAGQRAVSDRSGFAHLGNEFICGPITVRATKTGFREWTGSATQCGRQGNGNWGSEALGPIIMTPE